MTFEPPIHWNDYEDIAMKLYERFGDDFGESKIYRIRFTDLHKWVMEIPKFAGKPDESTEPERDFGRNACRGLHRFFALGLLGRGFARHLHGCGKRGVGSCVLVGDGEEAIRQLRTRGFGAAMDIGVHHVARSTLGQRRDHRNERGTETRGNRRSTASTGHGLRRGEDADEVIECQVPKSGWTVLHVTNCRRAGPQGD